MTSTSAPSCNSDLVYPTDWAPASNRHWQVALRCPECEWNGGGTYSQDVVDRFDEELERGTESVLEDLSVLVAGEHGGPDRALRHRPERGPDPPRGLLGIALHDAVGDQLEELALAGLEPRALQRTLGQLHAPAGAGPDLVQDAGGGDPVADRPRRPRRRGLAASAPRGSRRARARGSAAGSRCRRAGRCRGPCPCAPAGR